VYNRETASNSLMSAAKIPSSTPVAGAFNDRYAVTTYGRQVAFRSLSALLADHDTNGYIDSFVRDRAARTTTRVSISSTGAETNADVGETVISANGRYAAFVTAASTLYPGDVNYRDLFLRDLQTGEITRINIAPDGSPQTDYPPEYEPSSPSMSADGRFIAFTTGADNFLPAGYGGNQVFVRDRQAGTTEIVSAPATSGREYAITGYTSISADGRFVAFDSNSANLAPAGSSGYSQVYVRDRQTGQLTLVSHSATGVGVGGDEPVISADGRHVVFSSDSPNLVTGDTNGATDIFDFNLQTGVITRVSMAANGAQGNDDSGAPALSGSGRYIVFSSYAENLVATDENHQPDIFVRDMQTGATKLVSLTTAGEQANDGSYYPAISADGLTIVFSSRATNLVAADNNGAGDVFVRRVTN
jgi:Tol biopolymer transport system component